MRCGTWSGASRRRKSRWDGRCRWSTSRPYPEIGIPDSHHPLSHHENDPGKIDDLGPLNRYHVEQFRHPEKTPVTNLWMTLLDKQGVPSEQIGDSTGQVRHLWNL